MCDPWPVVWPCDTPPPAETAPEILAAALAAAQALLWSRTGRRLGLCTVNEPYIVPRGGQACGMPSLGDDLVWRNNVSAGPVCCEIFLASVPVHEILSVSVDGVDLPAGAWARYGDRLCRVGGCWPTSGSCDEPRIRVRYRWGVPLDAPDGQPKPLWWGLAATAMGEVATELVLGMCGEVCKLPSRVVSIARQGISIEMGSAATFAEQGLLGLPIADALIESTNPGRRHNRSRVFSPDIARRA